MSHAHRKLAEIWLAPVSLPLFNCTTATNVAILNDEKWRSSVAFSAFLLALCLSIVLEIALWSRLNIVTMVKCHQSIWIDCYFYAAFFPTIFCIQTRFSILEFDWTAFCTRTMNQSDWEKMTIWIWFHNKCDNSIDVQIKNMSHRGYDLSLIFYSQEFPPPICFSRCDSCSAM